MKWLFYALGIIVVIVGIMWFREVEPAFSNWQHWVSVLVIWTGVNLFGQYLVMCDREE